MRNYSNKSYWSIFGFRRGDVLFANAAAQETQVLVNTGNTDGKLERCRASASVNKLETETADDFVLDQTTVLTGATITGLVTTSLANISNVEIEMYHRFPQDSIADRTHRFPTRQKLPSDVEIDSATRDGNNHTLRFSTALLNPTFTALKTVVNSISVAQGEPAVTGAEVEITVTFTSPIVLPAGHYFFRPEVQVNGGDFPVPLGPQTDRRTGAKPLPETCKRGSATPNFRRTGCASGRTSLAAIPATGFQHDLYLERGEAGVSGHARSRRLPRRDHLRLGPSVRQHSFGGIRSRILQRQVAAKFVRSVLRRGVAGISGSKRPIP